MTSFYLHILRVRQTDWLTLKLVDPSYELHLAIVPKVHMVRRMLRIHTRSYDENEIAFVDHLHDFDATFDAALHTESIRLQRVNREPL